MTSKTEQKNKKVPIYIYFSDEQIPKYFSKLPFDDYILILSVLPVQLNL